VVSLALQRSFLVFCCLSSLVLALFPLLRLSELFVPREAVFLEMCPLLSLCEVAFVLRFCYSFGLFVFVVKVPVVVGDFD